jgi:hypothetical protein
MLSLLYLLSYFSMYLGRRDVQKRNGLLRMRRNATKHPPLTKEIDRKGARLNHLEPGTVTLRTLEALPQDR